MFSSRSILLTVATVSCVLAVSPFASASTLHESLSLDGAWEIVFDRRNEGREAGWNVDEVFRSLPHRRPIEVPRAWELIEQDYEGVAFYRREFDVPVDWKGKVARLQFDAVNYLAEVWLNGEAVGFHEGGFTPFELRVDRVLRPGERNVLVLRVVGPIVLTDTSVDGMGKLETPQWRGGITGGIWQSVRLVASGDVYVDDVYLRPDLAAEAARFSVTLDQTAAKSTTADIEILVTAADGSAPPVATLREALEIRPGVSRFDWSLDVPDPEPWSPGDPFLYEARIRILRDGDELDAWQHRFGFRELTIRNEDFYLNGERIYLKATFFEGLYPNGIASPDDEEMARREIRLAKEAGFNMIRPWRHPPVPRWLDLADEMGVLVVGSPALECMSLPRSTPYLPARVENEIRQSVLRDRNRTSVVQWELFNELHRPILMQMMRPMALLTRELDSTRLILDESGGWARGANIYLPGEFEPTRFNDIHSYPGPFINERRYDGFLTIGMTDDEKRELGFEGTTPGRNVVPGLMSFVSELGYGSLSDLPAVNERFRREGNPLTPAYRYHERLEREQQRMLEESGFSSLYPSLEEFFLEQQEIHGAANRRMIEAVRANPEVDGYCIHALVAGDWILGAGLLDLWRNPKIHAYEATRAANQPRILSIRMVPRNVYAERGANLSVIAVNELDAIDSRLLLEIVSADGTRVFSREERAGLTDGVSKIFQEALQTADLDGMYTVRARLEDVRGRVVTESSFGFDVFPASDLAVPQSKVAVLDVEGDLKRFLRTRGVPFEEFGESTPASVPVFVTRARPAEGDDHGPFARLIPFIEGGGTAVYVDGAGVRYRRNGDNQIRSETVPIHAEVNHAMGLWTCIPHLVREHPAFDGLPSDGPMREIYGNVWAPQTLVGAGGEPIVASIGFDWFSPDHKLGYSGPGASFWGSDMAWVRYGKGHCLLSELKIVQNLGSDPVADRLLFNLIRFVSRETP